MPSLPLLDVKANTNHSPHVVILGAGASVAACMNGDASGRQLPLMRNFVDVVGLAPLLQAHGVVNLYDDFEGLFDAIASDSANEGLVAQVERKVHEYFSGMRLPSNATIYDKLLLSLRSKDVIATFNWDPFLSDAIKRNRDITDLPRILFLHGNVDVGVCIEHKSKGFLEHRCHICQKPLTPTPLLFPVRKKDYSRNPFIAAEWDELRSALSQAYFITVFGYSAPVTDQEARELLLDAWKRNPVRELAQIEIIDVRPREEIVENWAPFFVRNNFGVFDRIDRSIAFKYVRRSCEAFAMATLQQRPWKENQFPVTDDLAAIRRWLAPLLAEERAGKLSGKPCD